MSGSSCADGIKEIARQVEGVNVAAAYTLRDSGGAYIVCAELQAEKIS